MLLIQIHYTCLLYWVVSCFPSNLIKWFCFSFREPSMPFIHSVDFLNPIMFWIVFSGEILHQCHIVKVGLGVIQIPTDPIKCSEIYQSHSLCILIQCMKFYCSWSRSLQTSLKKSSEMPLSLFSLLLWVLKTAKFDKWFKSSLYFFYLIYFQHRISFSIKEPIYVRWSPSVAHQQALCPWLKL